MKSYLDAIIQREQALYLESLLPARDALLAEMEAYSTAHQIPSSDPEVALFLELTARAIGATCALEIGTGIGYGAITLARAMAPNGRVVTIDPSAERVQTAREFIGRAGLQRQIEIIQDQALKALPRLAGPFDLAYIDAVKEEYPAYLELIVPRLRNCGVIIADNVLWKGQVATGRLRSPDQQQSTAALARFNQQITTHPQLRAVVLPLGDGLAYAVKIRD
jgi:predicted O-methyltransferase YrrM